MKKKLSAAAQREKNEKLKGQLGKIVPAFQKPAPDRLGQVAVELKPQTALRAEHDSFKRPPKNVKNWPAYALRIPPDLMREWRSAAHSLRLSMAKIAEDSLARHIEKLKDDHLALGGQWIEPPPKTRSR